MKGNHKNKGSKAFGRSREQKQAQERVLDPLEKINYDPNMDMMRPPWLVLANKPDRVFISRITAALHACPVCGPKMLSMLPDETWNRKYSFYLVEHPKNHLNKGCPRAINGEFYSNPLNVSNGQIFVGAFR